MDNKTQNINIGYTKNPASSHSLLADAYTKDEWFDADTKHIIGKTWQWVCHVEKTREPGSYVTVDIAGQPVMVVRDHKGELTMHGLTSLVVNCMVRLIPKI